jgi:hypothetical protein
VRRRFWPARRFNRSDPFSGNLSDPLSLHKYLYVHGDPRNAVDPSGENSLANVGITMAIGAALFAVGGAYLGNVFGAVNATYGLWQGQMDLKTAFQTWAMYVIRGAAIGGTFGLTIGSGPVGVVILGATLGITGIVNRLVGNTEDELLSVLPWLPGGLTPEGWISVLKDRIIDEANQHDLPPELIASVLLYELYQYNLLDTLVDDEVLSGSPRSIGVAQMRINNVRDWVPSQAGNSDAEIRARLVDPGASVGLLAEALAFMRTSYGQPATGTSVTAASWSAMPDSQREYVVRIFCSAKDLPWGLTSSAADTFGVYGLNRIESQGLLD